MRVYTQIFLLALAAGMGCRPATGPPAETVKKEAEALFERAVQGEAVPGIHFTGQGSALPKLIETEIKARRRIAQDPERFEYEVRLTYLNRIQQMEWGTVTITFERKGGKWEALRDGPKSP